MDRSVLQSIGFTKILASFDIQTRKIDIELHILLTGCYAALKVAELLTCIGKERYFRINLQILVLILLATVELSSYLMCDRGGLGIQYAQYIR